MKGKKLLCIVLTLAAVCSLLLVRDSVAWLNTQTGTEPSGTVKVDKMAFTFNGELAASLQYLNGVEYVVTDQNFIENDGTLSVTNESTIPTEVRFHITYVTPSYPAGKTYKAEATDSLSVTINDSHWVQTLDSNDQPTGYFEYYSVLPDPDGTTPEALAGTKGFAALAANATATPVDAITDIHYLDELIVNGSDVLSHNDYFVGGEAFKGEVHVVFEAKQAAYVDWQTVWTWANT